MRGYKKLFNWMKFLQIRRKWLVGFASFMQMKTKVIMVWTWNYGLILLLRRHYKLDWYLSMPYLSPFKHCVYKFGPIALSRRWHIPAHSTLSLIELPPTKHFLDFHPTANIYTFLSAILDSTFWAHFFSRRVYPTCPTLEITSKIIRYWANLPTCELGPSYMIWTSCSFCLFVLKLAMQNPPLVSFTSI